MDLMTDPTIAAASTLALVIQTAISALEPPTQAELARVTGQKPQAVTRWLRTGAVPPGHCAAIESATKRLVRCEDLRPDLDWQRDHTGQITGYLVRVLALAAGEGAN